MTNSNDWPDCEMCGGPIWKLRREPRISGFEDQFFTCSVCDHVMERTVVMSDEDLSALARAA